MFKSPHAHRSKSSAFIVCASDFITISYKNKHVKHLLKNCILEHQGCWPAQFIRRKEKGWDCVQVWTGIISSCGSCFVVFFFWLTIWWVYRKLIFPSTDPTTRGTRLWDRYPLQPRPAQINWFDGRPHVLVRLHFWQAKTPSCWLRPSLLIFRRYQSTKRSHYTGTCQRDATAHFYGRINSSVSVTDLEYDTRRRFKMSKTRVPHTPG